MAEAVYTECVVIGKSDKKYYVFATDDSSVTKDNWTSFVEAEQKFTYQRAKALAIAHNLHKRIQTRNGVWELY